MKRKDVKIGEYYIFRDEWGFYYKIYVIGECLIEKKLVVSCKDWSLGVSYLEDDDYEGILQKA